MPKPEAYALAPANNVGSARPPPIVFRKNPIPEPTVPAIPYIAKTYVPSILRSAPKIIKILSNAKFFHLKVIFYFFIKEVN